MGFYRGPNIVTDGLVLALDAGSTRSYSGSGTTAYNIIDNSSVSLLNGVGFSTANGGTWTLDGTDDYLQGTITASTFSGASTIGCWFYRETITSWSGLVSNCVGTNSCALLTFNGLSNQIGINNAGVSASGVFVDLGTNHLNKWIYCVLVISGSTSGSSVKVYAYEDGILSTSTGSLSWNLNTTSDYYVSRHFHGATQTLDGNIPIAQVYNRALTDAEVTQNFNAQKSRFGL